MIEWDRIRAPYQQHIHNIQRAIDDHSRAYLVTGDPEHKQCYDLLVEYLHTVKTYITRLEQNQ